jgi:hypothetical protein
VIENAVTFVTFLLGFGFSWKGINTNDALGKGDGADGPRFLDTYRSFTRRGSTRHGDRGATVRDQRTAVCGLGAKRQKSVHDSPNKAGDA